MREPQIETREGFDTSVWKLHKEGLSPHDIAERLDTTVNLVEEALRRRKDAWSPKLQR